jgi:hypothetical protein
MPKKPAQGRRPKTLIFYDFFYPFQFFFYSISVIFSRMRVAAGVRGFFLVQMQGKNEFLPAVGFAAGRIGFFQEGMEARVMPAPAHFPGHFKIIVRRNAKRLVADFPGQAGGIFLDIFQGKFHNIILH